ncbi:MAG: hypothetical protein JO290_01865 [Sphingomonadaceae bacterium]|nr:hypothetical protein [Sphingomonadaceae bacterium]
MTSATYVILSGALSFGAPLAVAVYEIVTLRRRGGGGDDGRDPPPAGPKPLPDCLQPHVLLQPRRIRELQDA